MRRVSLDRTRVDGVDPHLLGAPAVGHILGEVLEGAVHRAADGEIGRGRARRRADDVDDVPGAAFAQPRPGGAGHRDGAVEFQGEAIEKILVRQREEVASLRRPGAIDEEIETAEAGGRRLDEPRRMADIAQIRRERERRSGTASLRQLLGEPVEQILRAGDEGDGIAPLPEKGRDRASDPFARSGHDGAAARHVRSSGCCRAARQD